MPLSDIASWTELLRRTLQCYEAALLRQVAANLFKPRSQWPADELIERSITTLENAAVVDRRLQALDPPSRRLLAAFHLLQSSGESGR